MYHPYYVKLATFTNGAGPRAGVVVDDFVVDLSVAEPHLPTELSAIFAGGEAALTMAREAATRKLGRIPLADVRLSAPITRPPKFFAVGLNYADHIAEAGRSSVPDAPTVFAKMSSCVSGPFDDIECPLVSSELDYEGELGFVIGRRCRHVNRSEAHRVIGGYFVVNDVSVRDWQRETSQWTLGKSFDTHGPTGPWVVTPDEVADPHRLGIRTFVNGELRQDSNTEHLMHDCFVLVEHLSKVCALEPGDIVTTGTPAGVGAVMDPPRWLSPGDVVRVEIDKLGAIENRVVAEPSKETIV
jgi:2-keto-4-pentenoate hydratase/2-oxohepta-3-ene-1,7-dioic acid hydratase in catechol pathway